MADTLPTPQTEEAQQAQEYYARNKAWARQGVTSYVTRLSPQEEVQFQQWVKANNIPWQDSPTADYDMRGYFKAMQAGNQNARTAINPNDNKPHYPDTYKTPYHKSFSSESMYANPTLAPRWNPEDQLVLPNGSVVFDERAQAAARVAQKATQAKQDIPAVLGKIKGM